MPVGILYDLFFFFCPFVSLSVKSPWREKDNEVILIIIRKMKCWSHDWFPVPAPFSCSANSHRSILYERSGNLAIYMFPLPDDEPTKCVWRFKISSECKLLFDSFNLSDSKNCAYDYVKIHRARYCGTNRPSPTVASEGSGSEISITFKFNGKTRYPGFKRSSTSKREY